MTAGNDVVDLSKWNGTGSVNIGDAFSSDNDKVTVMANALAGAVAKDNLKLTSVENLEIVNSGVVETPVILKGANFKGLEAVKLIGDATILNVSDFTQGVKIDATANADYIIGSSKADTINGGAGNDTIVGNGGNDVLTGGNGADTFIVGDVKNFGVDQILDFSAEDKISMVGFTPNELKKFDASTFSTVTYKTLDSVLATFATGGANVTKKGDVVIFSYDGKTYALLSTVDGFKEDNGALVDITGANVASLTESNFGDATNINPPTPAPTPQGKTYPTYTDFKIDADLGYIAEGQQVGIATVTGAEAGILATNKTYLDKIAAGGIANVTGNIVVTVGKTSEASDNFDATAFETKLAADAVGSGIVMNITGTSKDDVIVASSFGGTITGGSGADIISLGAGKDTVVFSSKAAADANTLTNFTFANDKLSFDKTVFNGFKSSSAANTITDVSSATDVDTSNNTAIFRGTLDNLKTYLKAKAAVDNTKVVIAIATDVGNEGIYSVTLSHTGGSSAQASDIVKVGTLDVVNLSTLTIDNFIAGV